MSIDNKSNVVEQSMLTTIDNPYNPFTQFDEWNAFDIAMGYNTCAYLSRITKSSDEFSEEDDDLAIEHAMNEILEFNLTGMYIKVTKDSFKQRVVKNQLVI